MKSQPSPKPAGSLSLPQAIILLTSQEMLSSSGERPSVPQSWESPPPPIRTARQEGVLDHFRAYKIKLVFAYAGSWKVAVVLSFYEPDLIISSPLEPSSSFFFCL